MKTTTNQGSLDDYKGGIDIYQDKLFTFQLSNFNAKPSYQTQVDEKNVGRPVYFPPLVIIPATDLIFDEKTQTRRMIRYVPGEATIFADEMSKFAKENKANYSFKFINGTCIVEGHDKFKLEFFMRSNWNSGNEKKISEKPNPFFLVDREAKFKKALDNDKLLEQAKKWCNETTLPEILNFVRPRMGMQYEKGKDVSELRFNMKQLAALNPAKFLADISSPSLKRKGVLLNAIDSNILSVNVAQGTVAWGYNPSQPISTAAIGVDAIDHFVNITFTIEGERTYQEIIRQLLPVQTPAQLALKANLSANIASAVITEQSNYPLQSAPKPLDATGFSDEDAEKLVVSLFATGVIIKDGPAWIKQGGKADPKNKWSGRSALMRSLKEEPKVLASLKADLLAVASA